MATGSTMTDQAVSASSYAGAAVSVIAGLTLTEWGVVVGIITASVTFLLNIIYHQRNDARRQRLYELAVEQYQRRRRDDPPIDESEVPTLE